jgi:hypothetical protein
MTTKRLVRCVVCRTTRSLTPSEIDKERTFCKRCGNIELTYCYLPGTKPDKPKDDE